MHRPPLFLTIFFAFSKMRVVALGPQILHQGDLVNRLESKCIYVQLRWKKKIRWQSQGTLCAHN